MKFQSLITVALIAASGAALAQTTTPNIDRREVNQQNRITQGVASGQLAPGETARLDRREARIEQTEARAKADGRVTPAERRHLRREENRTSRAIYRDKHNRQHA